MGIAAADQTGFIGADFPRDAGSGSAGAGLRMPVVDYRKDFTKPPGMGSARID